MRKIIITLMTALLPLMAMAQSKNVSVDSVGTLGNQLTDSIRFKVTELKVSGPLNGADLKLLQQIVNRTKVNKKNEGEQLVTSIDLSDAVISEGKDGMKTKANELPNGMFSGAKQLIKVVLPKDIINIPNSCFDGCKSLREIQLPDGVKSIGNKAFEDCENLTAINIPQGVSAIGSDAFENCRSLTAIEIPADVKKINNATFKGCQSLRSVTMSKGVTSIGNDAFRD